LGRPISSSRRATKTRNDATTTRNGNPITRNGSTYAIGFARE
jgi:hypothetical protein